jgi:hypothetical protein
VAATYPTSITAAGIIWIIFGGLLLVNLVIHLFLLGLVAAGAAPAEAVAVSGNCFTLIATLFAVPFLYVGVLSVKGTARDTLGNSIGSLAFGVINVGFGWAGLLEGSVASLINLGTGIGLVVAGILTFRGRADYQAWRRAHRPPQKLQG